MKLRKRVWYVELRNHTSWDDNEVVKVMATSREEARDRANIDFTRFSIHSIYPARDKR